MKFIRLLSISLLVCCWGRQQAQSDTTFLKGIDFFGVADAGGKILVQEDGYLLVGESSNGGSVISLVRTDWLGNIIWIKHYGGNGNRWYGSSNPAEFVIPTADGNYALCGSVKQIDPSTGATNTDVLLMKFDSQGDTLWTRTFDYSRFEVGHSLVEAPDSGIAIVGLVHKNDRNYDVLLIKTDKNGDLEWKKEFGKQGGDQGNSICISPHGYMIGSSYQTYPNSDFQGWLMLVSPFGELLHDWSFGTKGDDCGVFLRPSYGNGFLMKHCFMDTVLDPGDDPYPHYIARLDVTGRIAWQTWLNSPLFTQIYDFMELADSSVLIAGYRKDEVTWTGQRGFLMRLDKTGAVMWERWHGPPCRMITDVAPTPDGGFIATGNAIFPGSNNSDVLLLKVDSEGCLEPGCPNQMGWVDIEQPLKAPPPFSLSPNPATHSLFLNCDLSQPTAITLTIYNLHGRQLRSQSMPLPQGENRIPVDIGGLPAGLYLLKVQTGEASWVEKFVRR